MELTREQAIAEHKKKWNQIADKIEKYKGKICIFEFEIDYMISNNIQLKNSLLTGEYANKFNDKDCEKCLSGVCELNSCFGGLDYKKCGFKTCQEQAALARQIANLPEKEDA